MTKVLTFDPSDPKAEAPVFEFPQLLEDEKVIYESVIQLKQSCLMGLLTVPDCCSTATVKLRIQCTNMRLLVGTFGREDRCCCVCCTLAAPEFAHNTLIEVEEFFWKDVKSVSKSSKVFSWMGCLFWCCLCCSFKGTPVGDQASISIRIAARTFPFTLLLPKKSAEELMSAVAHAKAENKVK